MSTFNPNPPWAMHPENDPEDSDRDDGTPDRPLVPDNNLSWLRTPLSMRQLCALGISVVGGGIPIAVALGRWAWLGLGMMVIAIIAMAMAHEGGWTRRGQ